MTIAALQRARNETPKIPSAGSKNQLDELMKVSVAAEKAAPPAMIEKN
jgi:hypothetical protein